MPKEVGFRVCICEKCGKTWQYFFHYSTRRDFEYLEDFPRYGLERKTCPGCDIKLVKILDDRRKKELLASRMRSRKRNNILQISN